MTSVRGQLEKREIVISIGTKRNLPIHRRVGIRTACVKHRADSLDADQFRGVLHVVRIFVMPGPRKDADCRHTISVNSVVQRFSLFT